MEKELDSDWPALTATQTSERFLVYLPAGFPLPTEMPTSRGQLERDLSSNQETTIGTFTQVLFTPLGKVSFSFYDYLARKGACPKR